MKSNRFPPVRRSSLCRNIGDARSAMPNGLYSWRSMTNTSGFADTLVAHFERIHEQHMRGLPIVNPRLAVEAVGLRDFNEEQLCVLITPWFMNLILWSETGGWDDAGEGELVGIDLPRESLEFTVCRVEETGTFLSAVLFRTTTDFPDQQTAREIAQETIRQLFSRATSAGQKLIGRRALFTGLEAN